MKKRNKGKRTKRNLQSGGASIEALNNVIKYLQEKQEEVTATIDKQAVKVKFVSPTTFMGVSGMDGKFTFSVKKPTMMSISASIIITPTINSKKQKFDGKQLVLDKLTEFESTVSSIQKNKEIKDKADALIKSNTEKERMEKEIAQNKEAVIAEKNKMDADAQMKLIQDSYVVSIIDLKDVMQKETVDKSVFEKFQTQPYTESAAKHLYYCVENYLMKTPLSIDKIKEFLTNFEQTTPHSEEKEPTISEDEVKDKIQFAINVISGERLGGIRYISQKNDLVEMLKKLNVKKIEPSNKYSFDKECKEPNDICFFMECIKFYELQDEMLDSITSISDIISNGTVTGYSNLAFLSIKGNVESYLGCVCYTDGPDVKISKMLENTVTTSEYKSEIRKLTDVLKPIVSDKTRATLNIPSSLDEYVDATIYKKVVKPDETPSEFSEWEMKPTVSSIVDKCTSDNCSAVTNIMQVTSGSLKQILLNLSALFEPTVAEPTVVEPTTNEPTVVEQTVVEPTTNEPTVVEPVVSEAAEEQEQKGGAISIDLQKHGDLQSIDEIIKSLPASVYKENESLINETINKINASDANPDISSIKPNMDELQQNSAIIKEVLKNDKIKALLPDKVKEEDDFVKEMEPVVEAIVPEAPEETVNAPEPELTEETKTPEVTEETKAPEVNAPEVTEETKTSDIPTEGESNAIPTSTVTTMDAQPVDTATTVTEMNEQQPSANMATNSQPVTTANVATTSTTQIEPTASVISSPDENITSSSSETEQLTMADLKMSPSMKNNNSNETGRYIFVPDKMVQLVVDYLLNNGCEVSTTVVKK